MMSAPAVIPVHNVDAAVEDQPNLPRVRLRADPSRDHVDGVVGPVESRPANGVAVDFVVESVPTQLVETVDRVRDGRLRTHVGTLATLDEAVPALTSTKRRGGKTVIHVQP
jgi:hypothetical protein